MLQIIRHSLTRRWVQSLSTLLTVAVSVGILFALYLFYLGVSLGLETGKKRLGADLLVVPADAWTVPEDVLFTGAPMNMYMDVGFEDKIRRIPGVSWVTSHFFTQTLNAECCSLANATRLIGFNPESDRLIMPLLKNDAKGKTFSPNEILIGAKVEGYSGSDAVILKNFFRIAAVLEPTGTSLDYSILMSIDAARRLSQLKENAYMEIYWKRYGRPENLISAILVEVDGNQRGEDIARSITKLGQLKVIQTTNVLRNIKGQMDSMLFIMMAAGLLTAASSVLNLFSRFSCMAWDRKGEWGLYRALGATRRDLKILVVGEALILAIGGVLPGIVLGHSFYKVMLEFLSKWKVFPFIAPSFPAELFGAAGILVVFSLIGVISAWLPAYQSSKIEPSTAMALKDID